MAAKLEGETDLIYAQVPFVQSAFINKTVASICARYGKMPV